MRVEEAVAGETRFLLRLPPRLYAALVRLAQRETRSLHGQIIHLLRQGAIEAGEDPDSEPKGERK
jgi:hypothetical protein